MLLAWESEQPSLQPSITRYINNWDGTVWCGHTKLLLQSLRLSNKARQASSVGEIVNLMSVDVQCITDFLPRLQLIWSVPLQGIIAMISLYFTMGISIFAGVGVMLAMIPLNAWLGGWSRMIHMKQMKFKDTRTKIINEVLNGIKVCE